MKKTDMTGVECFLGEYLGKERRFLLIHEPYDHLSYETRRSDEMEDYQETKTEIGGRKAVVRTYHTTDESAYYSHEKGQTTYVAELHVGDWARGDLELFMSLESKSSADLDVAKGIFNSVDFVKGKGTPNDAMQPTAGQQECHPELGRTYVDRAAADGGRSAASFTDRVRGYLLEACVCEIL